MGNEINFWNDKLVDNIEYPKPPNWRYYQLNTKSWDLNKIINLCPNFVTDKFYATPISLNSRKDKVMWAFTKNGSLTLKSAYNWLFSR